MNSNRMLRPAVWILAILALGSIGLLVQSWRSWPFDDLPFAADLWRAADSTTRARLADDALRHIAVGWSAKEIESLLGQPEKIISDRRQDAGGNPLDGRVTYSYYLGSWSLVAWDDAFLYVNLDDDGRVVSTEVIGY